MSDHFIIQCTKWAIELSINQKGMSVHDGMIKIPRDHADWLIKRAEEITVLREALERIADGVWATPSNIAHEALQQGRR